LFFYINGWPEGGDLSKFDEDFSRLEYKYHYEYQVNRLVSNLESNFAVADLNKNNELTRM